MSARYRNPVIPGFYPDPSICRVGQDYYLVTSSFEYFPGVPIFHSLDLVHWRQIGHCLTRASQLPLAGAGSSQGIFAPTIRFHAGRFYMITTNITAGKNLIVSADDPAREWSEPSWIDQEGIDPSLFFDDDGVVYFTWTKHLAIHQAEIDVATGQLLTPPRVIWKGTGGRYPEAPHLYKINKTYYLLIAEGGTEYGHMETAARSSSPWGPFEPCPRNPILTHRNLGAHVIQGTGHADLVQAHDGSWWMVFLAFRQVEQYRQYHHLGRETFLAPVTWTDDGWLKVNHGDRIEIEMEVEGLPFHEWEADLLHDSFDAAVLNPCWNFLRNPIPDDYSLTERPGWLRLKGSSLTLDDAASPTFLGRRQQHFDCTAAARLEFTPHRDGEEAGLTVLMNEKHHYEIAVRQLEGIRQIIVRKRIGDLSAIVASHPLPDGIIDLFVQAERLRYTFAYSIAGSGDQTPHVLAIGETRYVSTEVAGGFTGVYFGMYATGQSPESRAVADFDWFEYKPNEET